jgi:hypothetical protein
MGEEGSLEDLLERSEEVVRGLEGRFNEISGKLIELQGLQASIQKLTRGLI